MKKYLVVFGIISTAAIFTNCSSAKKAAAVVEKPKLTYSNEVSAVIMKDCTPCHIPAKGGNKKAYDNFANVKTDIDEILRRIQLNPTDRGFMPFKHAKLPDSTIAVFAQWKTDGMLEK